MKKNPPQITLGLATLLLASVTVTAQTVTPPPQAPPSPYDAWEDSMKTPLDWLTWGADFRARNEYLNNAITLTPNAALSEQDLFRFRARLWSTVTPLTNVSFFGRISAEPREWMKPAFASQYKAQQGMEWRYGIADSLNLKMTELFGQPLTLTVGRQDILLGDFYDWWLVADGTPLDGSWTAFIDSARLTYEAKPIKTKFDVMYLSQMANPGERIPTIGSSSDYFLTEQNEKGVVVYASNKSIENMTLDGYFIYKGDDQVMPNGDNADIYTLGAKVTGTPAANWQYSVEGAYQFGQKQDPTVRPVSTAWRNISAYGGKAKLTYLTKDSLNNQFSLMGEFLSGDKSDTPGQDEMFDILWGRWPRWSELYIYSYINETGGKIAQMNNLGRVGPGWTIAPMKGMTFGATYNAMFAQQATPTRRLDASANAFSYNGNFRGHYLQTVLKHEFNKHIKAHLWAEFVWEGNYYAASETMTFLRGEVMFTF